MNWELSMKTFAFATVKGGVGKTSIALQTAKILSENYRVLMLDLDPQSAATAHIVTDKIAGTIRNVFNEEKNIEDVIINVGKNFDFIPSEIELAYVEAEMSSVPNSSFRIFQKLTDPTESSIESDYDFCVIDSPPAVGLLMNSAIIASDITIIPTQLESWSVRGIGPTLKAVATCRKAKSLVKKGIKEIILANMYDNRVVKNEFLNFLKVQYEDKFYPKPIHHRSDISSTFSSAGEFLPENSKSYEEYKSFVDFLLGVKNG
jgi:chromosome partitioning protein